MDPSDAKQQPFSHSLTARAAAAAVIETARKMKILDGPIRTAPELAEMEKFLFVSLFDAVRRREGGLGNGLEPDEISAMFTFVFLRAAEAVTIFRSGEGHFEFDAAGLFGGPTPYYADEKIGAVFKAHHDFPSECAVSFLKLARGLPAGGPEPLLTLFEAMKWCFRLGCHLGLA